MNPRPPVNLLPAALLAGLILSTAGCSRSDPAAANAATVPVQTARAIRQTLAFTQTTIGAVQSLKTVTVKSQVDGVIEQIHFREGDEVKTGDLLVTLDRRPFENALLMARADLANAHAESDHAVADAQRYAHLDQQSVVSKEELAQYMTKAETTQAQVQAKEAAVASAELQLSYAEIRAPIAGRTGQLTLREGSLVKANDNSFPIVTINQLAPITVAYAMPENMLGVLRVSREAGVVAVAVRTHDGGPARSIDGRLDFVDNAVDQTTGTILLKAVFANDDHALWPGQFVDVDTLLGVDKDVLVVPTAAVQTGQHGSQIFVVKSDQTVELRDVQTGRVAAGATIIRAGLSEGDTVVTDGQLRLVPGSRVEATTLAPPPPVATGAQPAAPGHDS